MDSNQVTIPAINLEASTAFYRKMVFRTTQTIPRQQWSFAHLTDGRAVPDASHV